MPTQLQQQPNVTYMHSVHQPPPVVPQQNQQVLQGGLSVTRSEAALLTTNQQQPQQQVPQQNQQGLHAGLTVTRPETQAALLTTSLQQPQQQLPHQQQ